MWTGIWEKKISRVKYGVLFPRCDRASITPELLPMTLTKQKQTHTSTVVVDIVSHVIEKYVRLLSFFPPKQQQILILLY